MSLFAKVSEHLKRTQLARRFGVQFSRRATFQLPQRIRLDGRWVSLSFPPEGGVANDFLCCLLEDNYGLSRARGPVKTILDIGGNVGFFSLAARSWFPQARIHVYEPNPRILPFLRANADVARAEVFPEAVGAADGFVNLDDHGDSNQAHTVQSAAGNIPQTALATVVARLGGSVDLAKIDCEGAEWEMLQDAESWKRFRRLRMEYHLVSGHSLEELRTRLRDLGFRIIFESPGGESWGTLWADNTR